ncbi:hypothetical protein F5Y03DRAFT_404478 [Xylaria venustula]|nr:hypothetical protein F5Y03DRAFT_404478 [Xylaria venustula]
MPSSTVYTCGLERDGIVVKHISADHEQSNLRIKFKRTIRVPDNAGDAKLPPDLGNFSLFKIRDFASKLPAYMVDQGGVFFSMYQREAMWISFRADDPFMIKIYAGGVNVVSGENSSETEETKQRRLQLISDKESIQDYLVVPGQMWIDGFAVAPGVVRQFVAMPLGMGYTVEAQLTGREMAGGIQFEITPSIPNWKFVSMYRPDMVICVKTLTGKRIPIKCSSHDSVGNIKEYIQNTEGIPTDQQRLAFLGKQLDESPTLSEYGVQHNDEMNLTLRLRGGGGWYGPMGVAAGGKIDQEIHRDCENPNRWAKDSTITIPVHILTTAMFREVTGQQPPPCPISISTYTDAGLPFFDLPEEPSGISGAFDGVKSVHEINVDRGIASSEEPSVKPRVVTIGRGEGSSAKSWVNRETIHDPDGLVSPNGPLRAFRTLSILHEELKEYDGKQTE